MLIYSGLSVSSAGDFTASGTEGGPFHPDSQAYELRNLGNVSSLNWTASRASNWVSLSATAGTLAPGASTTVIVSLNTNADAFAAGAYQDFVSFVDTTYGGGDRFPRAVNLYINRGLEVNPSGDFYGYGPVGGPFSTSGSGNFSLVNGTDGTVDWMVDHVPDWMTVSITSGTLTPSATAFLTISINANADNLVADNYSDVISFRNLSNSRDITTLPVAVYIGSGPPVITSQLGHHTVSPGTTVTFRVGVTGPGPFSYAWLHDGLPVAASSGALTLANVTDPQAGHYSVSVSNPNGTANSAVGTLALLDLRFRIPQIIVVGGPTNMEAALTLSAASGDRYRIDYTDNLQSNNWMLFNYVTTPTTISDTNWQNAPTRFYRAVYAP